MLSRSSTCFRLTRPCTHFFLNFRHTSSGHPSKSSTASGDREELKPSCDHSKSSQQLPPSFGNVSRRLQAIRITFGFNHPSPSVEEHIRWQAATHARNVREAMAAVGDELVDAPSWVIIYILGRKVHDPQDAMAAVNLMLRAFHKAQAPDKISMILLCIQSLVLQNVAIPVPKLVRLFLVLPHANPDTHFNLLLQLMSRLRTSPPIAKSATEVLEVMDQRGIALFSQTYTVLLSNKLVNLELAKMLQERMINDGIEPDLQHLTAYLRAFSREGAVHGAAQYLNLIKVEKERKGKRPPHGAIVTDNSVELEPSTHERGGLSGHSTSFLKSMKHDSKNAFHYLQQMVQHESEVVYKPKPRKIQRIGRVRASRLSGRTFRTVDWMTVLNALSRNKEISAETLFESFDSSQKLTGFSMSVPAFTVLMRGIAKRGDYVTAEAVWRRCCASWNRRKTMDARALTVAMDILVGANKALEAFDTLIQATSVVDRFTSEAIGVLRRPVTEGKWRARNLRSNRAKIDSWLINALMCAFLKHGRPEMVFKFWDAYVPLFGVHPDAESLTALIIAADRVSRFDNTFRGVLEHLGLHNLFTRANDKPTTFAGRPKIEIIKSLRVSIGMQKASTVSDSGEKGVEKREVATVRKSLWNGDLAAPKALTIFREIILGNFPELFDVVPPARAVWSDEARSANPMRDAARMLGIRWLGGDSEPARPTPKPKAPPGTDTGPKLFGPSSTLLSNILRAPSTESSSEEDSARKEALEREFFTSLVIPSSSFPQIMPSRQMFAAYISLLGSLSRSSEIAVALAWQRHLGIMPLRRDLADAMALWAEASMRGPLLEDIGGDSGSEFQKMKRWLENWVGEEMPDESDMGEAFWRLKAKRESKYCTDEANTDR